MGASVGVSLGCGVVGAAVGVAVGDAVPHEVADKRITKPCDCQHAHTYCDAPVPITGPMLLATSSVHTVDVVSHVCVPALHGCGVGSAVGLTVGLCVGAAVGLFVGDAVVGCGVGGAGRLHVMLVM